MKGDFSRFTFDRRKHYADVRLQQGRVQLDADWNEQLDIAAYHRNTLAVDLIGRSGAPEIDGGFDIKIIGNVPRITPGRYYVDGLLCENEQEVLITEQPDLPEFTLPTADGDYVAYLDVWQRSITALEDPDLLELALKGADTAARLRTMWQVKLHQRAAGDPAISSGWEPDLRPRPTLEARTVGGAAGDVTENQLYRIEVHKPGPFGVATFKWSRDNGSVAALIQNPATTENIRVTRQIGPDQGGFETGQWIEVTDETKLLQDQPGLFVRLSSASGQVLAVEGWPALSDPPPNLPKQPQIRRWDSDADQIATNNVYIQLDAALEVRFGGLANAWFRTGDYWVVPVRAGAGVRWPADGSGAPLALPPHGVQHHYAPLYLLQRSGGTWTITGTPYRQIFEGKADGGYKLNRHRDDRMTASLEITGTLTVETGLTVENALTYRNGSQLAGRVLTSDAEGRATWKAPIVFLRLEVDRWDKQFPPRSEVSVDWTRFSLPSDLPSGIQAVILEAEAGKFRPDQDDDLFSDAWIKIRRGTGAPDDPENTLLRGRAAGDEDNISWSNQGIFPVHNNSFEYTITHFGFQDWAIYVVGYFP